MTLGPRLQKGRNMFGKLLKHEFKSLGKWYFTLYGIVLSLSVILGIWMKSVVYRIDHNANVNTNGLGNTEGLLFGIMWFAFMLLIAGLVISTFILVVSRFYKNIYGRQGYLTMTLPVTSHQIILSKFAAAIMWYTFAGLTILLSISIIAFLAIPTEAYPFIGKEFNQLIIALQEIDAISILSVFISGLLDSIGGVFLAYFSISIGQLFKDHRLLMAIITYFGINFVIGSFTTTAILSTGYMSNLNFFPFFQPLHIVMNLVLILIYYFGTHYIMTKKLNLQ